MVPSPAAAVEDILARMRDAGFTADDTVVLLAAHSVATQRTIDYSVVGMPLDSTPERFDNQFYLEVISCFACQPTIVNIQSFLQWSRFSCEALCILAHRRTKLASKQNHRLHTFFDLLQTRRLHGIRSRHANGSILLVEQNAFGPSLVSSCAD